LQLNDGYPLLLSERAKQELTRALWNDTLFLSSINVMDYSLLVGIVHSPNPTNQAQHTRTAHPALPRPGHTGAEQPLPAGGPPPAQPAAPPPLPAAPGDAAAPAVPSTVPSTVTSALAPGVSSVVTSSAPPHAPTAGGEWILVVGLIDYCRQYTWKEEAESRMKRSTVIPPKQYKRRFREALNRYFMCSMEKYHE
jgi:hypothetical protein